MKTRAAALLSGSVLTFGLVVAGGAISESSTHGPRNPGLWVPTAVSTCEYDIDAQHVAEPHERIRALVGEHQTVCPFVAGQSAPVAALVISSGEACSLPIRPDLKVVRQTKIGARQFLKELQRCDPMMGVSVTPPETSRSPGPVFVIRASEPDVQLYGKHFAEVHDALARSGLPISYAVDWGVNGTHFYCFEMLPGDDVDPLTYLKAHSPWLASAGVESRSAAANCSKAVREFGVEAVTRLSAPRTVSSQYALPIARSTASPEHEKYRTAVLDAFRRQGVSAARVPPDPGVQSTLADKDTYARYNLRAGDLDGTNVALEFNGTGFRVRTTKLSSTLCGGLFAAMTATDSFVREADFETPALVPQGVHGDPPAHPLIQSLAWIGDAQELCRAVQPSFDRWRTEHVRGS